LAEDIMQTSSNELLAEVAEDYGNPQAFSAEFDRLIKPTIQKINMELSKAAPNHQRASDETYSSAGLMGWLTRLLDRIGLSGSEAFFPMRFQAAIASLVVIAITGFVLVKELYPRIGREETASSKSPSGKQPVTPNGSSQQDDVAPSHASRGIYFVEVVE